MKAYLRPFLGFLLFSTFFSFASVLGLHLAQGPERTLIAMNHYLDRFLADERELGSEPFFAPPGRSSDAGELLNPRVEWEGLATPAAADSRISVPDELYSRIQQFRSDWPSRCAEVSCREAGLAWMKQLARFDHWDIFESGPLRERLDSTPDQNPFSIPMPDFRKLVALGQLRLMRGAIDRQPLEALGETRALARLMYSTETHVGARWALHLLAAERVAYEHYLAYGLLGAADWKPISEARLEKAHRAMEAFNGIFAPSTPVETLRRVFLQSGSRVGVCSGLLEGVLASSVSRPFLDHSSSLERDFGEKFALMDRILQEHGADCRLSYARRLWADEKASLAWIHGGSPLNSLYGYGQKIPFVRQAMGLNLMKDLESNGFLAYERGP